MEGVCALVVGEGGQKDKPMLAYSYQGHSRKNIKAMLCVTDTGAYGSHSCAQRGKKGKRRKTSLALLTHSDSSSRTQIESICILSKKGEKN